MFNCDSLTMIRNHTLDKLPLKTKLLGHAPIHIRYKDDVIGIMKSQLYLTPKQPSFKTVCGSRLWKKMWNLRWQPRIGCDGRLIAKILMTTIKVNLCCLLHISLGLGTKFTWIIIIKKIAINLQNHHSHFLATTLDFTSFFIIGTSFFTTRTTLFFTTWLFLD